MQNRLESNTSLFVSLYSSILRMSGCNIETLRSSADHRLFRPSHATELHDIAEAAIQFPFAPQFRAIPRINLAPLVV